MRVKCEWYIKCVTMCSAIAQLAISWKIRMSGTRNLIFLVIVCVISHVELSQDVVKNISVNFSKPFETCRKELDLPESVGKEFANFWKDGYELVDRQTGCAIMCMSAKLDLLDAEYKLHHGNAKDFAMKHGADAAMAQQLVDIIHGCAGSITPDPDACAATLAVARCFKSEIHKLNWAPSPELIMAEILAEA